MEDDTVYMGHTRCLKPKKQLLKGYENAIVILYRPFAYLLYVLALCQTQKSLLPNSFRVPEKMGRLIKMGSLLLYGH